MQSSVLGDAAGGSARPPAVWMAARTATRLAVNYVSWPLIGCPVTIET